VVSGALGLELGLGGAWLLVEVVAVAEIGETEPDTERPNEDEDGSLIVPLLVPLTSPGGGVGPVEFEFSPKVPKGEVDPLALSF